MFLLGLRSEFDRHSNIAYIQGKPGKSDVRMFPSEEKFISNIVYNGYVPLYTLPIIFELEVHH